MYTWLNAGAAILVVVGFFLALFHQLSPGDFAEILLNYVLLYSTVAVLVRRGSLGPNIRGIRDLWNMKLPLILLIACVGVLPIALLNGKPTAPAYRWSVAMTNGIFLGAAILLLLTDRSMAAAPVVVVDYLDDAVVDVAAALPAKEPDGADEAWNEDQEEVEVAVGEDELSDDNEDEYEGEQL